MQIFHNHIEGLCMLELDLKSQNMNSSVLHKAPTWTLNTFGMITLQWLLIITLFSTQTFVITVVNAQCRTAYVYCVFVTITASKTSKSTSLFFLCCCWMLRKSQISAFSMICFFISLCENYVGWSKQNGQDMIYC